LNASPFFDWHVEGKLPRLFFDSIGMEELTERNGQRENSG
jgi:hypothetical protein